MPGSIQSSTAVDLSRLPAPDIVEQLDYETILAAMLDDLVSRDPTFDQLTDADPAMKVLQVAAYRELLVRQRSNEASRACMVAYAKGADLDQLGAIFGVIRLEITPADPDEGIPAILETDDELRRRILLAPDSYSVAGPASAYVFHALSADPDVRDASATSPAPGQVVVAVLSRTGDGTADQRLLDTVASQVNGDTVRPLTDQVSVQSANLIDFDVEAVLHLYSGPDANLILATAQAGLTSFLEDARRLGRDVPLSAIMAALSVAGVHRVELVSPAADVVVNAVSAPAPGDIAITTAETGE